MTLAGTVVVTAVQQLPRRRHTRRRRWPSLLFCLLEALQAQSTERLASVYSGISAYQNVSGALQLQLAWLQEKPQKSLLNDLGRPSFCLDRVE